jgi:TonB family protein
MLPIRPKESQFCIKEIMEVQTMGAGKMMKRAASLAVLVLLAGMAMPGRAADERAIKSRVSPVYPEIAKRMRISGVVKVEVTVDAEGKVTDVKPVSGNQMLSTAAQDAVRKWKFAAGDGATTMTLDINFNLN